MFSRSTAMTYCIETTIFPLKYLREPVCFGLWGHLGSASLCQASAGTVQFSLWTLKYGRKIMVPSNKLHFVLNPLLEPLSQILGEMVQPSCYIQKWITLHQHHWPETVLSFRPPSCHYRVKFKMIKKIKSVASAAPVLKHLKGSEEKYVSELSYWAILTKTYWQKKGGRIPLPFAIMINTETDVFTLTR